MPIGDGRRLFLEDWDCGRESKWIQSISVGTRGFFEKTKQILGIKSNGRRVVETGDAYQLREPQVSYSSNFGHENEDIGPENTYFWDVY
jgi:REP-associated tyrosine transposase